MDKTAKEAEKNMKEFQKHLSQIPRAPPVVEGTDSKKSLDKPGGSKTDNFGKNGRGLLPKNNQSNSLSNGLEHPKLLDYSFTIRKSHMVDVMKTHPSSRPPRLMRSDPNLRDQTVWYEFHGTHRQKTTNYRHLWEEVENMIAGGHLQEYLRDNGRNNYGKDNPAVEKDAQTASSHVINIIFGRATIVGTSFIVSWKMKISVTREKRTREFLENEAITFSDEDAAGVTLPHNDTLVITILTENFQVNRVMVDLGSLANILHLKVVEEMGMLEKMIPTAQILFGFNMASDIEFAIEAGESRS
ncbi:uncharacterized protein LOC132630914 [Lycium barbarum]|uniref:uncharacterized protein LOC132630914 n=1 Tax=Lycium barbarum TaxID=112863 RepID=UPI00293F6B2D|nr:uncharacterized protein LOC132630914 [Lycium barbarum]